MLKTSEADVCFKYQEGWTEGFKSKSDVDFVVEDAVLPVHSTFFYHSELLRACLSDTTNVAKATLKSCFKGTKKEVMDEFLCQIYPCGRSLEDMSTEHLLEVVFLASKLDCSCVKRRLKRHVEENTSIIARDFKTRNETATHQWFSALNQFDSSAISDKVTKCTRDLLESALDSRSSASWCSVSRSAPSETIQELTFSIADENLEELKGLLSREMTVSIDCLSCGRQKMVITGNLSDTGISDLCQGISTPSASFNVCSPVCKGLEGYALTLGLT